MAEVLANAATAGASVHICHTLATGRYAGPSGVADMLEMVTRINQQGVDISMEQYPYPYGMTNIKSEQFAVWKPEVNLRTVRRADTGAMLTGPAAAHAGRTVDGSRSEVAGEVLVGGAMWLDTGEFLTEPSFAAYREQVRQGCHAGPGVGPTSAFRSCTPIGVHGRTCIF
jgi:hypothetical protein